MASKVAGVVKEFNFGSETMVCHTFTGVNSGDTYTYSGRVDDYWVASVSSVNGNGGVEYDGVKFTFRPSSEGTSMNLFVVRGE